MHARLTRLGTAVSAAMLAGISCSSGPPPVVAPAPAASAAAEAPAPSPPAAPGARACDKQVLVEIDWKARLEAPRQIRARVQTDRCSSSVLQKFEHVFATRTLGGTTI
jgi:hypothetical protein